MDERTERIINVALEMAEEDGYDAVRLRDLAARADVALGTVYRRFSSKEDILAGVLDHVVGAFRDAVVASPIEGDTVADRICTFLELSTAALAQRPKLAGAMMRTVASGVPEIAERVLRYRDTMTEIVVVVARGAHIPEDPPTENELLLAHLVQDVWFAAMVGWTGGLHSAEDVVTQSQRATRLIIRGMESS